MLAAPVKATDSVNQFAAAYNVGRFEAGAAINLLKHVPHEVKNRLQSLVRTVSRSLFLRIWFIRSIKAC